VCVLGEVGSLSTVVGFCVALNLVNNGTSERAAAQILCGTVRVVLYSDFFSTNFAT
jgi:hypothetical protein